MSEQFFTHPIPNQNAKNLISTGYDFLNSISKKVQKSNVNSTLVPIQTTIGKKMVSNGKSNDQSINTEGKSPNNRFKLTLESFFEEKDTQANDSNRENQMLLDGNSNDAKTFSFQIASPRFTTKTELSSPIFEPKEKIHNESIDGETTMQEFQDTIDSSLPDIKITEDEVEEEPSDTHDHTNRKIAGSSLLYDTIYGSLQENNSDDSIVKIDKEPEDEKCETAQHIPVDSIVKIKKKPQDESKCETTGLQNKEVVEKQKKKKININRSGYYQQNKQEQRKKSSLFTKNRNVNLPPKNNTMSMKRKHDSITSLSSSVEPEKKFSKTTSLFTKNRNVNLPPKNNTMSMKRKHDSITSLSSSVEPEKKFSKTTSTLQQEQNHEQIDIESLTEIEKMMIQYYRQGTHGFCPLNQNNSFGQPSLSSNSVSTTISRRLKKKDIVFDQQYCDELSEKLGGDKVYIKTRKNGQKYLCLDLCTGLRMMQKDLAPLIGISAPTLSKQFSSINSNLPRTAEAQTVRNSWPARSILCANEAIQKLLVHSKDVLEMSEEDSKVWLVDHTKIPIVEGDDSPKNQQRILLKQLVKEREFLHNPVTLTIPI